MINIRYQSMGDKWVQYIICVMYVEQMEKIVQCLNTCRHWRLEGGTRGYLHGGCLRSEESASKGTHWMTGIGGREDVWGMIKISVFKWYNYCNQWVYVCPTAVFLMTRQLLGMKLDKSQWSAAKYSAANPLASDVHESLLANKLAE